MSAAGCAHCGRNPKIGQEHTATCPIEVKASEIYLTEYGKIGGRWECVETKQHWYGLAMATLNQQ